MANALSRADTCWSSTTRDVRKVAERFGNPDRLLREDGGAVAAEWRPGCAATAPLHAIYVWGPNRACVTFVYAAAAEHLYESQVQSDKGGGLIASGPLCVNVPGVSSFLANPPRGVRLP